MHGGEVDDADLHRHVVVVLNYHGREDTERCVSSIVGGSPEATVLVVDNGSDDGTLESVARRWPGVSTLGNPDNLGFAGGMNSGLRWALERGAETITVLNNDTTLPAGALAALAEVAGEGHAVTPEVRYADGSERVWFAGGVIDRTTGLARHLSTAELGGVDARGRRATDMLAGCCITARAATWRTVGLFDERYFLNFEDSDWSVRARQAGVDLVVDTGVVIHHAVSASFTGAYTYLGLFYYTRNGLLFVRERVPGQRLRAARFVRRHVVPDVVGRLRSGRWTEGGRRGLVVLAAIWCWSRGVHGRAPRWLEERARRWSSGS